MTVADDQPESLQPMFIVEKKVYVSGKRQVIEYITVSGEPPENFHRFMGVISVSANMGGSVIESEHYIPLPFDTLQECFVKLDAEMPKHQQAIKDELLAKYAKPQVQRATTVPKKLMGTGG